jgi:hypothetical protein
VPVIRNLIVAAFLTCSAAGLGQTLAVGALGTPTGTFEPGVTVMDFSALSKQVGNLTTATFFWSAAPCTATVKIKLGNQSPGFPPFNTYHLVFAGERGPFDVLQTTQTVALVPPLPVSLGYQIAIAGVTSCGRPVSGEAKPPPGGSLVLQGDWMTTSASLAVPFKASTPLSVLVQGSDDAVVLINNRFRITLAATDPRTGVTAVGRGISQGDRYGYFSLPAFTGDSDFPEVIVKMADATTAPPPYGGAFWFFYSALTDVQYTLTVTDQVTGNTRAYSSTAGGPGQLCGGVDTDAFRPQWRRD